jgi:hypothetical protein
MAGANVGAFIGGGRASPLSIGGIRTLAPKLEAAKLKALSDRTDK